MITSTYRTADGKRHAVQTDDTLTVFENGLIIAEHHITPDTTPGECWTLVSAEPEVTEPETAERVEIPLSDTMTTTTTVAEAREIFARVEGWRMARRAREQFRAARIRTELRNDMITAGLTWSDALAIADWYSANVYDPRKPWTCPL
jgi:hypothetical protein